MGELVFDHQIIIRTREGIEPIPITKKAEINKALLASIYANKTTDVSESDNGHKFYTDTTDWEIPDNPLFEKAKNAEEITEIATEEIKKLIKAIEPRAKVTVKWMEHRFRDWDFVHGDDEFFDEPDGSDEGEERNEE